MSVVAKFICTGNAEVGGGAFRVTFVPKPLSDDPADPNRTVWEATPAGTIDLTLSNPAAAAYFEVDGVYLLTFDRG